MQSSYFDTLTVSQVEVSLRATKSLNVTMCTCRLLCPSASLAPSTARACCRPLSMWDCVWMLTARPNTTSRSFAPMLAAVWPVDLPDRLNTVLLEVAKRTAPTRTCPESISNASWSTMHAAASTSFLKLAGSPQNSLSMMDVDASRTNTRSAQGTHGGS